MNFDTAAAAAAAAAAAKNAPTGVLQQAQISQQRTLRFQVCNGFANQRLAVLYGVLIAHGTRRAVVLPSLIRSGSQKTFTQVTATEGNMVGFESMYNSAHFKSALKQHGMLVIEPSDAPPTANYTSVPLDHPDIIAALSTQHASTDHVSIGCPLFRLPARYVEEAEQLAWAVLDNLRPSDSLQAYIDTVSSRLQDLTLTVKYNFLHLRIEKDWQDHCRRWTAIKDGVVRDNCMNNTLTVDEQLQDKGISPELPLYIASHWPDSDHGEVARVRSKLQRYGFQLITSQDITYDARVDRETAALIDYFLALKSEHFIGNSVSTFSGLQLMERHHRGSWASYYNGGNTPLTDFLPLDPLPWIFTYNSWSSQYDYMLKAAVLSGVKAAKLKPHCLFSGDTSSAIFKFLIANNVTILQHVPAWREELLAKARPLMAQNTMHSHLYAHEDALIGTFQRVDIPMLSTLRQYNFVFFTDADVFFTRRLSLSSFPLPLPTSLAMATEMVDMFPYNAGIMLMNLVTLRRTYVQFLAFLLNNKNGMYFPGFGPGDQGAYNQFYESTARAAKLTQAYNAKPYLMAQPMAYVVHFHGPKPHHYLDYIEKGSCEFGEMCKRGFQRALCGYLDHWYESIPEDPVAVRLRKACDYLRMFMPQVQSPTSESLTAALSTSKRLKSKGMAAMAPGNAADSSQDNNQLAPHRCPPGKRCDGLQSAVGVEVQALGSISTRSFWRRFR